MTDEAEGEKAPLTAPGGVWRALGAAAVVLSAFAPRTAYVGVALALVLLGAALTMRRRDVRVRGMVLAAISSVLIAGGSTYACNELFPGESEVGGKERVDHERHGDSFERAFDEAARAPGGGGNR